ncbi:TetR/AcrR family transcriptional regulator, partial [Streptomyces bacillaris]|uniref:TetR/AcrR family transcriptional regulator n=1 Tax=Streptomyces bacillaris TaxID=68179 RepID=UPI0036D8FE9F
MANRGPYAKGRERRDAILGATVALFSTTGYRGTSFRAIADELGITATLIQHYFPTREELLTEVIRAWDDQNARASAGLPMIDAFLGNIRRNTRIPGLVRLYTAYAVESGDPDHAARPFFQER